MLNFTDKHVEEGGAAQGNELLVLENFVQDAARCQHQQSVSESILVSFRWERLPISSRKTHQCIMHATCFRLED